MAAPPDPSLPGAEPGLSWEHRTVPPAPRVRVRRFLRLPRPPWDQRIAVAAGVLLLVTFGSLLAVSCTPSHAPPPEPVYTPASLSSLSGWSEDRLIEARPALERSCAVFLKRDPAASPARDGSHARAVAGTVLDWRAACVALAAVPEGDAQAFRSALEANFQGLAVTPDRGEGRGLFTGYYEAHIRAARQRGGAYQVPVYAVPSDLVMVDGQGRRRAENGGTALYSDRAAIEDGALDGRAPVLLWADDPVDLHILHIQGSGQVILADGGRTRIGYAANNGQPFVGIGRLVRERGLADGASMPAIRAWLRANPAQGRALMRENPRYIFFREVVGDGPIGALGVPLTPLRSLAVDPDVIPLGAPVWLETTDPDGRPLRRLMVAQDTGSAIRGVVRGDVFWGAGEQAFQQAGRMASPGRYVLLVPRPAADSLRLM